MDLGQPEEALDNIDRAVELSSESAVTLRLQGRAFHQLNQIEDAVAAYQQAIILDRDDAWSMNNLALVYIERQEFDSAILALARAIQLDSTVAVFHNNLGMALENTERFRAAENAYRNALVADATYVRAKTNLARIEQVEGDIAEAEIDLAALAESFDLSISTWIVDSVTPASDSETDSDAVVIAGDDGGADLEHPVEDEESTGSEESVSVPDAGTIEF